MLKFFNNIDRFIHRMLEAMCSLFLAAMVGFTIYNVTMRYVFNNPPVWGDLLTVLSNIWLMFIALSLTARDNKHIAICLLSLAVRESAININQILLNTVNKSPQTGGLLKTYRIVTL